MDSKQLNFAIVGAGSIGKKRAKALGTCAGVNLCYVGDRLFERAQELASNVAAVPLTDLEILAKDPSINAVIVATHHSALFEVAERLLGSGKHLLIEKPGALRSSQLFSLHEMATKRHLKVRIGYNHRFHPAVIEAQKIIESGKLGPLMFIRGRYGHGGRLGYEKEWRADRKLAGGGELIDQGVHLIDLSRLFLGDFSSVDGHIATYYWKMDVEDNAFLSLRTKTGQTAWLHASCTEWKNLFSLEIYGKYGKISIDGLGGTYGTERLTHYRMLPEMGPPRVTELVYNDEDVSWNLEVTAFIRDITENVQPEPGLIDGIEVLKIVELLYKRSGDILHDNYPITA